MYRTHAVAGAAAQQLESQQPVIHIFHFSSSRFPEPWYLKPTSASLPPHFADIDTCTRGCCTVARASTQVYHDLPSPQRSKGLFLTFLLNNTYSTEAGDCDVTARITQAPSLLWETEQINLHSTYPSCCLFQDGTPIVKILMRINSCASQRHQPIVGRFRGFCWLCFYVDFCVDPRRRCARCRYAATLAHQIPCSKPRRQREK